MKRAEKIAAALVALLVCWLHLPTAERGPWPPRFSSFTLSNGLEADYLQGKTSALSVVQVLVRGGSRMDPAGREGLTCLTLSLVLQIPDSTLVHRLMEMGSTYYQSLENDYGLITIVCQSRFLDETLKIICPVMADPLLSGLRINAIKDHMKALQKSENDQPLDRLRLLLAQAFFAGTPCGHSAYGNADSLKAITRDDIAASHRALFCSGNLKVAAASDLDEPAVREIISRRFAAFASGPAVAPPPAAANANPPKELSQRLEQKQSHIAIAWRLGGAEPLGANVIRGVLLETLLGQGAGSRLWALRSRQDLAYAFGAFDLNLSCGSLFCVYVKTESGRGGEGLAALRNILADLWQNGVDEGEFAATQTMAEADLLRRSESKEQLSALPLRLEGLGLGAAFADGFASRLRSVSREEFNAFLRSALSPEGRMEITIGPEAAK